MNTTKVVYVFILSVSLCFGVLVSAFGGDIFDEIAPNSKTVNTLPPQYMNLINPKVQLQENEWVKVVDSFSYELTPEEFFGKSSDDSIVRMEKDYRRKWGESANFRIIGVDIQFLKPCRASREGPGAAEEQAEQRFLYKETIMEQLSERVGVSMEQPAELRFRCDYRTKTFVTFYDKHGREIKTDGEMPKALNDSGPTKMEMFPGEKTYVSFIVPEKAAYWYVWVPK